MTYPLAPTADPRREPGAPERRRSLRSDGRVSLAPGRPVAGRVLRALALAGLGAALAACSGGRDMIGTAMGLNYESPNPFNVSPNAPLRLPPSYETLPPPSPGARSPLEPQPGQAAQAALASAGGGSAQPVQGAAPTPGELALLEAAGASAADPGIRQTLETERPPEKESIYALDSVFGYKINDPDAEQTLDARDESDVLRSQGAQTPTPTPAAPETPSNAISIPLGG
ncbi:DUF3035 domain-containing protein [uncultured Albimonas sp.]|uniref:DUF3035 domain-containing protein n=1 Tax=uncultured Albimonas sp. TaxID=1331701 RepID=UPI0030EB5C61|tara:strand:+ start:3760 stop:4443 length:684 start_codon:yes stop_codon:yes gene_type:complete